MELALVRRYLRALEEALALPSLAADARDLVTELASPLNQVAETFADIVKAPEHTPLEAFLLRAVRRQTELGA